ncbi:hem peroxidase [Pleurostoma richardsiae]|uniref:Peroxidase n=1 Tax=Pleurostoma richardsiae TaxID=41990 RepID=A0AA38RT80_9PEZI|nr:hem peroxidase [Pleurostoma richardsiae]
MIGDLVNGTTTRVGEQVRDCLTGDGDCTNSTPKTYTPPGDLNSEACSADACCVWEYIQRNLTVLFIDTNGTCNNLARSAVRLGFHDAGAWSTSSGWGGADGSIVLNADEISRSENSGLQTIRSTALDFLEVYGDYGVGAADLVQFMHNVATVACPLGPRVLTYVGRHDDDTAAPVGLVPSTQSDADFLVGLFENKTFSAIDLASLIGAHTVAHQFFTELSRAGLPLDSTPGVWDTNFYSELLSSSSPSGLFRLPSDDALRTDSRLTVSLTTFADSSTGQDIWTRRYARAYHCDSIRIRVITDECSNSSNSIRDVVGHGLGKFYGTE